MSDTSHPRPTPIRDIVQGPVTWQVTLAGALMLLLHAGLDRYVDPAQYGPVWAAVELLVEAGIVAVVGWWSTRRAIIQAERFVTPVVDPAVVRVRDGRARLVRLVPDPGDTGRAWPAPPAEDVGFSDLSDPPPDRPLTTED